MTNATHTPGPWEAADNNTGTGTNIRNGAGTLLAVVHSYRANPDKSYPNADTRRANARLISAAPDLLEALERAIEYVERFGDMNHEPLPGDCAATLYASRAAIAKARGSGEG